MRQLLLGLAVVLAACGAAPAGETEVEPAAEAALEPAPQEVPEAVLLTEAPAPADPIICEGAWVQGGGAVCHVPPGATVTDRDITVTADDNGWAFIGFDRDAPAEVTFNITLPDGTTRTRVFAVEQRDYDVQRIDGLPPSQVNEYTDEQLVQIRAASARKAEAAKMRAPISAFTQGFIMPIDGVRTSDFGPQRILNGVPKTPHYGVDLAAPEGTPVKAPGDGVIAMADNDLYFEGAMIIIDHGQGVHTKYLHLSRIDVEVGQEVKQGDIIGAVGSRGRSTGPHLCWRLRWNNRNLDPTRFVGFAFEE